MYLLTGYHQFTKNFIRIFLCKPLDAPCPLTKRVSGGWNTAFLYFRKGWEGGLGTPAWLGITVMKPWHGILQHGLGSWLV